MVAGSEAGTLAQRPVHRVNWRDQPGAAGVPSASDYQKNGCAILLPFSHACLKKPSPRYKIPFRQNEQAGFRARRVSEECALLPYYTENGNKLLVFYRSNPQVTRSTAPLGAPLRAKAKKVISGRFQHTTRRESCPTRLPWIPSKSSKK